ncbi:hypothetical protein K9F62_02995 [Desulfovibrio sp. JY]|nr:hypothetical protein K9F62_02995 [Desulfovibrio sp. JY]
MKNKLFVGDIGTVIVLDVGQDITGATVAMRVKKPDGSIVTWDAVVTDDATGISHTIAAGELNESGIYRVQAVVALADASWSGSGDWANIEVYK